MEYCDKSKFVSTIAFFEILLRNKINDALVIAAKQPDWYNVIFFDKYTEKMLNDAKQKLDSRKIPYDDGHIIAELNLGFWTSLFHKHNSQYSFQGIVCKKTFLNCPPGERKYKTIYDRLDKIRFLRNRVSHYERIIHWSDLRDQHDLILLLIKYMDNEFYNRLIPFDTFNDTINSGIDVWKEKASKFMQVQGDTELKQIQSEAQ